VLCLGKGDTKILEPFLASVLATSLFRQEKEDYPAIFLTPHNYLGTDVNCKIK
jgi:hypothetical protein